MIGFEGSLVYLKLFYLEGVLITFNNLLRIQGAYGVYTYIAYGFLFSILNIFRRFEYLCLNSLI